MANFQTLIAQINNYVKQNGEGLITGQGLQTILDNMVAALGNGANYKGKATAQTAPGTPDANVWYIAEPGIYNNFGGAVVRAGHIGFLSWDGSWTLAEVEVSPAEISTDNLADEAVTTAKVAKDAITGDKVADGAITAAKMASKLVTALLATGYKYAGVATPATNPGTPGQNVFYIAATTDVYPYFGYLSVDYGEIAVLKYNGSTWAKDSVFVSDFRPAKNTAEFGIVDGDGNMIAKIDAEGIKTIAYITKSSKYLDDGDGAFKIVDANGYIGFKVNGRSNVIQQVGEAKIKQLSQPALSWIDDDFLVNDGGGLRPQYTALRNWALDSSVNARVDFALIPDNNKVAQVLQWEAENFRFLMHPSHDSWYDDARVPYVHNIDLVKQHLHDCIYFFKHNGINSDCKIIVWPGDSDTYDDNVEVVRNLCECGIKATSDGCNYGNESPIYHLRRINIEPNADRPKSLIKKRIKAYLDAGAWVIMYTHLYGVTGSGTGETDNSMDNVLEIAAYAHGLCPLRNTEAIWNERRFLYNL